MSKNPRIFAIAVLFTSAIIGLALASASYTAIAQTALPHLQTQFDPCGTLLPLTLAFLAGFSVLRLPFLSLLVMSRFFALTFSTYLQYVQKGGLAFGIVLIVSAIEGLLFLSFCRLSYLFGSAYRKKHPKHRQYCLQYVGDYLFSCGISVLIAALPSA